MKTKECTFKIIGDDISRDMALDDEHPSVPANTQEELYLKPHSLESLLSMLHHTLLPFKEISFAYLFGSAVRGDDFRDIDVAVYLIPYPPPHTEVCGSEVCGYSSYERFKFAMRIGRTIEKALFIRREVDVRILNEAPPSFQYEVMRTGQLIFQREKQRRICYEGHILSRYLDYQPIWSALINQYFKGDCGMEQQVELFQHLQEMDEALADWERYRTNITEEAINTNRDTRNMVMFATLTNDFVLWHAMLISIQSCLDIANHLIVRENLRRPATYREAFEILTEASVIPQELSEELADLAGFRNILVHVYWRLDLHRVYEILQYGLTPLRQFRNITSQLLAQQDEG
jgi:uncharacterized protein YutE (UPF0331/DUF86 family)/predicted nucleotidyltransferase